MKAFVVVGIDKYDVLEDRGFIFDSELEVSKKTKDGYKDTVYGVLCDRHGLEYTPFPAHVYFNNERTIRPYDVVISLCSWIYYTEETMPCILLELEVDSSRLMTGISRMDKDVMFISEINQEDIQAVYKVSSKNDGIDISVVRTDEYAEDVFSKIDVLIPSDGYIYETEFYSKSGWTSLRNDYTLAENFKCLNDSFKQEVVKNLNSKDFEWKDIKDKTPLDLGL